MSDRRGFGSNCHPCSQSRKISIGVLVDSSVKQIPKTTKEDEPAVPSAEKISTSKVQSVGDGNNWEGAKAAIRGNQTDATEKGNSPWVSTRSFQQRKPTSEVVHYANFITDSPDASDTCNGLKGVKADTSAYSVQFFANRKSILQTGDCKQKKFDRVSYRREERGNNGTKERVEGFCFATAQETVLPEKEVVEDKPNRTENRSEVLRMKLWEILGTVPSPDKQVSQAPELGVNNITPGQNTDKKSKPVVKPRQNSDSIESDSESHGQTIKRPVTRSLTRKRAPSTVQINKNRYLPSSTYVRKDAEKNIFSFKEGVFGRLDGAVTGDSSKSVGKKRDKMMFRNEAHGICFPAKNKPDDIQPKADMTKTTNRNEKPPSHGNKMQSSHGCLPENNTKFVHLKNGNQEKGSLKSQVKKMIGQPGSMNNSTFPEHEGEQKDFGNSSKKNNSVPAKCFSPGSSLKTNTGELDDHTAAHCSFNSLLASEQDNHRTNVLMESSDETEGSEDSPLMKSKATVDEKDGKNGSSKSSSEERGSKSSEEGSPINKGRGTASLSPELDSAGKPKVAFRQSKRLRSKEDINLNGFSPTLASPKGTEDRDAPEGPSDQNQEDGLANAITLFALALKRVKSKIKFVHTKKSSEVLRSVAEGIQLQLQNAESQIQRDMEKLTSLSKSKRRRLETEFNEQQGQLKLIYQKFNEEVNRHLQDCKTTLEGLEAQETEFIGIVENHKTSQRKLLKQVEEAIETQVNEAERRITAVHKMASARMLQLKHALAECLKEGILC